MPWVRNSTGLRYEGEPHWDHDELTNLFEQLKQTRQNRPEAICAKLNSSLRQKFIDRDTIWQFSKWCHWSHKNAEAISRRIGELVFGKYPQPRLWDESNRPTPNAENHYQTWVEDVVSQNLTAKPRPLHSIREEENVNALDTMLGLLHQFRQVILYGPPGTGKTRLARLGALAILSDESTRWNEKEVSESLSAFRNEGRFELVVFHPAYEYEQFIGGIAPRLGEHGLQYAVQTGPFFNLCKWVRNNNQPAALVIDEINRGNLPKLMGELVYAIEYRDNHVTLPFQVEPLEVPKDLYIIGTMNSSDRSIGHIDAAIRRRFGLMLVGPDRSVVEEFWNDADVGECGVRLADLMDRINNRFVNGEQAAEIGVGHSYFIGDRNRGERDGVVDLRRQVERKWMFQVEPLLREYQQLTDIEHDLRLYKQELQSALAAAPERTTPRAVYSDRHNTR